jgi:hypothetical protein
MLHLKFLLEEMWTFRVSWSAVVYSPDSIKCTGNEVDFSLFWVRKCCPVLYLTVAGNTYEIWEFQEVQISKGTPYTFQVPIQLQEIGLFCSVYNLALGPNEVQHNGCYCVKSTVLVLFLKFCIYTTVPQYMKISKQVKPKT